ncbi:MAG: FAD-dependent 5-carboxymethylaminomethyl-2-thiouridine(34) oxidoreductase MnmC [Pseudomonadales bacterium]
MNGYILEYAEITWRDELTPFSTNYKDIYWSGGLEEKQHVFIDGNDLASHCQACGPALVVGEIGFGFGLNFLLTVQSWRQHARHDGRHLHYVAIENRPVDPRDLATLYSRLLPDPHTGTTASNLNETAERLLTQYPLPTPGRHRRWFYEDVCLTLIFDDVHKALDTFDAPVDIWYLDGFSPSVNEDIWQTATYDAVARKSAPQATLSTYTVAGHVRRGLMDAGFNVQRQPGFGQKAEMLQARLTARPPSKRSITHKPETVIIGAGMAGLYCARALARRGGRPTIVEAGNEALSGASAISQMAVYPQLALQPGPWNYFSLAAFQHLCVSEPAMRATGFCLVPENDERQDRLVRLAACFPDSFLEYLDEKNLAAATGLGVQSSGAIYHTAGWLDVDAAFKETLAETELITNCPISDLKLANQGWQLLDSDGNAIMEAENVIIATGTGTMPLLSSLPLGTVRGQSLNLRITSAQPKTVFGGPVTVFPPREGLSTLSATYEADSNDLSIRQHDTDLLMDKIRRMIPDLQCEITGSTVGLRSVPRDRMPIVGKVPDPQALENWNRLRHTRRPPFDGHLTGLYVCSGFGSHGATHAKLCAEYLTALICDEPSPLTPEWRQLLAPERF